MDLRAGLADAENLSPTGILPPDRLARNKSLYRLSYPGPLYVLYYYISTVRSMCAADCGQHVEK
jgi:hypothetical protein